MIDGSVFGDVADALRGLARVENGPLRCTYHRYGIKVWFGPEKAPREHYEAQIVGPQHALQASVMALEVGFHSEHPDEGANEIVISGLRGSEAAWRAELGDEPVVGTFLGRARNWRRVSEVWPDPDLGDPELVFELAARLTDYLIALEPHRPSRSGAKGS